MTDRSGKRIAGARVKLQWTRDLRQRRSPKRRAMGSAAALESYTTLRAGWFVFRDLWPGDRYKVVVEAPGHGKTETPEVSGKAGETHDFGSIVLTGLDGHIAGRVVGSDGRPIAGATVFNRGDGPRPVEALTDDTGPVPARGACSRGPSTRSSARRVIASPGLKAEGDADDLAITLLKTTEPPPAWKPAASADASRISGPSPGGC